MKTAKRKSSSDGTVVNCTQIRYVDVVVVNTFLLVIIYVLTSLRKMQKNWIKKNAASMIGLSTMKCSSP